MPDKNICTIELNLDDDFASSCAYHVDYLSRTIATNVGHAEAGQKTDRWALVGLARDINEAQDKAEQLRMLLCKKHNKNPIDLF